MYMPLPWSKVDLRAEIKKGRIAGMDGGVEEEN